MTDFPVIVDNTVRMEPMTAEQQLDYTQRLRLGIANQLAPDEVIPTESPARRELMSVAAAIDQQILARKQADIDSKNAGSKERVANFLADLHSIGDSNMLHRTTVPVERDVSPDLSFLDDKEVTEHMLSQEANSGDTNFTDFSKEFKLNNPQYDD